MTQILIVDEDTNVLRLLRIKLGAAGYEILRARDGGEALALVDQNRPKLVVMEGLQPDMSGSQLLRELLEALGPTCPILILSGETDDETIRSMLAAGASDYVTKPFSPQALLERIRVNLIRYGAAVSTEEGS